jgi:hypothetical protein
MTLCFAACWCIPCTTGRCRICELAVVYSCGELCGALKHTHTLSIQQLKAGGTNIVADWELVCCTVLLGRELHTWRPATAPCTDVLSNFFALRQGLMPCSCPYEGKAFW